MKALKSIFDGWYNQIINKQHGETDGHCAVGWCNAVWRRKTMTPDNIVATVNRVASYIRANYNLPEYYLHPVENQLFNMKTHRDPNGVDTLPLVYANNVLGITPERFRAIDLHMQVIEALRRMQSLETSAYPQTLQGTTMSDTNIKE